MSKRARRVGVKAILAKYSISEQRYRNWRNRVNGIKPKKQLSRMEKLKILEEGYLNGINEASASGGWLLEGYAPS